MRYPWDDIDPDETPEVRQRRVRREHLAAEERGRCLRAEVSALIDNKLVICDAGFSESPSRAQLFELRRRRATNGNWIDVENALLGRPKRPGRGVPGFMCMRFKSGLRNIAEAGRGGMTLRSRKLPAAKRFVICGAPTDAPVRRISRSNTSGKNYELTFFAGLRRRHAAQLVKDIIAEMADEVDRGLYNDAELRCIRQHLEQYEVIESRWRNANASDKSE